MKVLLPFYTHTQSHIRLDAGPTLLINTSFACRNFNHWQRSKDQEDDNYDDVVIAATTMRKTCQCMCHECRHKRRKEKGVYWRGRWAVGDGWGGVASRQPAQTTQTTAHTFLICHHGKWPSEMPLPPREKLLYWPESAVWCCMRFSFLHFSYVSLTGFISAVQSFLWKLHTYFQHQNYKPIDEPTNQFEISKGVPHMSLLVG